MSNLTSLKILFAGSGEFGLPTLRALLDGGAEIIQVVTQPDRPAGRGRKLTPTPIGQFAIERGLPLLRTDNINSESLTAADAMVVIAFGQKISQETANRPRLGSVNLHASRLPLYRGAAPIHWAILNGEATTGNSVIRLAPRMDAGAILGRSLVPIGEMETTGELHDQLAVDGAALMTQVLGNLSENKAIEWPQDDASATTAPKLSRDVSHLDWRRPAAEIGRRICGLYPWPGCRARLIDADGGEIQRLTLVRARPAAPSSLSPDGVSAEAAPGSLDDSGRVAAGDSYVEIVEVQPEGGRPMTLQAYRNGRSWPAGGRIESVI